MKKATSINLGMIVASCFLATGVAWAKPPFPVPAKGGLPQCEAELAECLLELTEKETQLQICEDELAQCQATPGQAFPATGQTTCWYFDGEQGQYVDDPDCTNPASAGQDGDIQAGADLSYTDNGLTITDNNTKLEWMKQDDNDSFGIGIQRCDSYPGNLDRDCFFTWDEAFTFVANLNANNHGGYDDWRVPNVKELQSIVNYEFNNPTVSAEFNTGCVAGCTVDICSCTAAGFYWSSMSRSIFPNDAWGVFFDDGFVLTDSKILDGLVRAVRGGL